MSDDIPTDIILLGSGSYGTIVSEPESNTCRKIFSIESAMSFIREVFVIKKLSHIEGVTEIVNLDYPKAIDQKAIAYVRPSHTAWGVIVMKKYHINLGKWLQLNPSLEYRYRILIQILIIMAQVHMIGIIHADLKLENIMLTNEGDVRIIDWGLSGYKGYARIQNTTKTYRPEKITQDYCHDIYSLGVVMIQIILGMRIVNGLEYTSCCRMLDTAVCDRSVRNLIAKMIHPDCKTRPTIYEIISFFDIDILPSVKDMNQKYTILPIPSSYGLRNIEYPFYFKELWDRYPEARNTIICIIAAMYRCKNSSKLISRLNYDHLIFILKE